MKDKQLMAERKDLAAQLETLGHTTLGNITTAKDTAMVNLSIQMEKHKKASIKKTNSLLSKNWIII